MMPTREETNADGSSRTADARVQKSALPVRGTSAQRKKALLDKKIQRERAEAGRVERGKEDALRRKKVNIERMKEGALPKKKANGKEISNERASEVGGEEVRAMETESTWGGCK